MATLICTNPEDIHLTHAYSWHVSGYTVGTETVLLHGAAAEVFHPKFIPDFFQLEGHVDFLYAVTAVMARLQSRQPLSDPPEDYDGDLVDAHPPWPTPTASQWAEIQLPYG